MTRANKPTGIFGTKVNNGENECTEREGERVRSEGRRQWRNEYFNGSVSALSESIIASTGDRLTRTILRTYYTCRQSAAFAGV